MTTKYANDPAALWREMLGQWEQGMNAMATQTMSSGEFSREMNRVLGASLRLQKGTQELIGRYFDALNLPTKDDLRALGERLQAMETQLGRIERIVEHLAEGRGTPATAAAPVKRTRRYRAPGDSA